MSSLVIPNVFTNGTVINSSPFNQNFGNIVTWSTAIDNTNIGPAGLFANQLLPTTGAQATFGATAVGIGYKFLANDVTAVPLTVSGVSGQTADIFDVTLTSGGTNAFKIGSTGAATFGFALSAAGLTSTAGIAAGGAITGATTGAFSGLLTAWSLSTEQAVLGMVPAGGVSTQQAAVAWNYSGGQGEADLMTGYNPGSTAIGFYAWTGSSYRNVANIGNAGTGGYLPPVYTAAGAATASTLHMLSGSSTAAYITTTPTITLSGSAAFSSSSSYQVVCTPTVNLAGLAVSFVVTKSAGSFTVATYNSGENEGSVTFDWVAIGT